MTLEEMLANKAKNQAHDEIEAILGPWTRAIQKEFHYGNGLTLATEINGVRHTIGTLFTAIGRTLKEARTIELFDNYRKEIVNSVGKGKK